LALGEDGVERQGGLTRPGQAGEDDQLVARKIEVDIAQVVLPRAADKEVVAHAGHGKRTPPHRTTVRRGGMAHTAVAARRYAPCRNQGTAAPGTRLRRTGRRGTMRS